MSYGVAEVMGSFGQRFRPRRSVGEALHELIVRSHKHRARKHAEECWGLDAKTARNFVTNKNVSPNTLTKAAAAEGWDLWHALGVELFGETYADHLRGVADAYEQQRARTLAHRDHIQNLEDRAARVVALLDRPAA